MSENNEEILKELKKIKEMLTLNEKLLIEIFGMLNDKKEDEKINECLNEENSKFYNADSDVDPFYFEAVEAVIEWGKATTSAIQRKLRLGYARTCRIIDKMEEDKIIETSNGSNPKKLLITKEQWEKMKEEKYNK